MVRRIVHAVRGQRTVVRRDGSRAAGRRRYESAGGLPAAPRQHSGIRAVLVGVPPALGGGLRGGPVRDLRVRAPAHAIPAGGRGLPAAHRHRVRLLLTRGARIRTAVRVGGGGTACVAARGRCPRAGAAARSAAGSTVPGTLFALLRGAEFRASGRRRGVAQLPAATSRLAHRCDHCRGLRAHARAAVVRSHDDRDAGHVLGRAIPARGLAGLLPRHARIRRLDGLCRAGGRPCAGGGRMPADTAHSMACHPVARTPRRCRARTDARVGAPACRIRHGCVDVEVHDRNGAGHCDPGGLPAGQCRDTVAARRRRGRRAAGHIRGGLPRAVRARVPGQRAGAGRPRARAAAILAAGGVRFAAPVPGVRALRAAARCRAVRLSDGCRDSAGSARLRQRRDCAAWPASHPSAGGGRLRRVHGAQPRVPGRVHDAVLAGVGEGVAARRLLPGAGGALRADDGAAGVPGLLP